MSCQLLNSDMLILELIGADAVQKLGEHIEQLVRDSVWNPGQVCNELALVLDGDAKEV